MKLPGMAFWTFPGMRTCESVLRFREILLVLAGLLPGDSTLEKMRSSTLKKQQIPGSFLD